MTTTSQNGWPVDPPLTPLAWITGNVRVGDVHTILDHLCARFNAEVEPIIRGHSWGYANRAIRGSTTTSNHASGTAIDLNAPAHPLGKRGTFTTAQAATIRSILADLDGAIRWGGDYSGRPDEMHFEINTDPAALKRVVENLEDAMKPEDWKQLRAIVREEVVAASDRLIEDVDTGQVQNPTEQGVKSMSMSRMLWNILKLCQRIARKVGA